MLKIIYIFFIFSIYLCAVEPSAFEAGDLNIAHPYGLTNDEKVILKNKREVEKLSTNVGFLKTKLFNMQEDIDGIRTVVQSQNMQFSQVIKKIVILQQNDENLSKQLQNIKNDLNQTISTQEKNYQKIKLVLSEFSSLIDSINNSYISKETFEKKLNDFESNINNKIIKLQSQTFKNQFSRKKRRQIFLDAKKFFENKQYNKATILFQESIKRKYLPATSNFYLGEINYFSKNYIKAIEFYKKSITLYSKTTSFTPTLLFHTYLSFKKIGDSKNAKKFKIILIKKYPTSKEAKLAKKF